MKNEYDEVTFANGDKIMISRIEHYFSFEDANAFCENSNECLRLPTQRELKLMFEQKDNILYFATGYTSYWCSEVYNQGRYIFLIGTGNFVCSNSKNEKHHVGFIKTI